jgi:O-methyltransferase domain
MAPAERPTVALPAGADGYVMKAILHDWEDDDAVRILRTCRAGGRERTRDEFAALLAVGGFALDRTIPSAIGLSVFEARPA